MKEADRKELEASLVRALQESKDKLLAALDRLLEDWTYSDYIYRYYHHSFKVFRIQECTEEIVALLQSLLPERSLNAGFTSVVAAGTGKEFTRGTNAIWDSETLPLLQAFFHAKFFLEMACRYAVTPHEGNMLESGWAAFLYLYDLR